MATIEEFWEQIHALRVPEPVDARWLLAYALERGYPQHFGDAKLVDALWTIGLRDEEIAGLRAALAASEGARRQAVEEWAVRGACLRSLRARLPQPTLDDLCDWQRDRIDAVLARPEPPADGLREAVNLALADLRAALSMNDDPYVEEIIDHAANLLGAGMRGAGEGAEETNVAMD